MIAAALSTGSIIGMVASALAGLAVFSAVSGRGLLKKLRPLPAMPTLQQQQAQMGLPGLDFGALFAQAVPTPLAELDEFEQWQQAVFETLAGVAGEVVSLKANITALDALVRDGFENALNDANDRAGKATRQGAQAFLGGSLVTIGGTIASILLS